MKIIFSALFCALFSLSICGQTEPGENKPAEEVGIEEILLARDDGSGKPGEVVNGFITTDVPIYCLVTLNSTKSVVVKVNFVAVAANGLKPGAVVVAINFQTSGKQKGVRFNAAPDGGAWSAGKYRVDISLDGRAAKSLDFEIQKSPKEVEKQVPPKPNPKPKTTRRNPKAKNQAGN